MKKTLLALFAILSLVPLLSGCFIYWDDWGGFGHGDHGGHHDDGGGRGGGHRGGSGGGGR